MKLEDVLFITDEGTTVNVVDYESNEVISRYDGKDSIETKLNKKEVVKQYVQNNELFIVVLQQEGGTWLNKYFICKVVMSGNQQIV